MNEPTAEQIEELVTRCLEDALSEAWRLGGAKKGINVSERAE